MHLRPPERPCSWWRTTPNSARYRSIVSDVSAVVDLTQRYVVVFLLMSRYAGQERRTRAAKCSHEASHCGGKEQDALDGHPWDRSAGVRMVELLIASLADWEARLAALQNSDEE